MGTEYQDAYCMGNKTGWMGRSPAGGQMGGSGGPGGRGEDDGSGYKQCDKDYIQQPVGGRAQAKAKTAAKAKVTALPVYDEDFVATVYNAADRGTHRVQPQWRDPRWSEAMRADTATLYEPADRDPCNRTEFYLYRSTLVDPLHTPAQPLSSQEVHKLRYMHNNYMNPDDWY